MDQATPSGPRQRQAAALLAAEKRSGKSRTRLAADLDLGYDQYARYVNGSTPLRVEQIESFATAYGVPPITLGLAILTGDVSALADPWTFRGALHGKIPEAHIDGLAAEWEGRAIEDQKAAVEDILENARIAREKATRARRRRNRSA